jgi:para-aminobenzoate synthetase component I
MTTRSSCPGDLAWFDGLLATDVADRTSDPAALDATGWWAVVCTFEGARTFVRFRNVRRAPLPPAPWRGPHLDAWRSSLDREAYVAACAQVRRRIFSGHVYQVNICRVLSAEVDRPEDVVGLARVLDAGNPAPFAGVISVGDVQVVTASPELFLRRRGAMVESGPIKGTGLTEAHLQDKDATENIMIVDLVRNDLSIVCEPGSVEVPSLLEVQRHPGLVHLVSTVRGRLRQGVAWADLLAATSPPGSVSGTPKSTALRLIEELEAGPRGPYCGVIGYVDADAKTARLAVGIRTFWLVGTRLFFGTGAGITWGSDPQAEWAETELKAARLIALASGAPSSARTSDPHGRGGRVGRPLLG